MKFKDYISNNRLNEEFEEILADPVDVESYILDQLKEYKVEVKLIEVKFEKMANAVMIYYVFGDDTIEGFINDKREIVKIIKEEIPFIMDHFNIEIKNKVPNQSTPEKNIGMVTYYLKPKS